MKVVNRLLYRSLLRPFYLICLFAIFIWVGNVNSGIYPVTNTDDSGAGSLRFAIRTAIQVAGKDTITFNIPGVGPHTIQLLSALPVLSDGIIIDGTTEPAYNGSPIIEVSGNFAGNTSGFILASQRSAIRGLVIKRFRQDGIEIRRDSCEVSSCYIGLDATGVNADGIQGNGILIQSSGNLIGGNLPQTRNVISGNGGNGILISPPAQFPEIVIENNRIIGNYIGVDVSGAAKIPNTLSGVTIRDAERNHVGAGSVGMGNVISGNQQNGILINSSSGQANSNIVQGNTIGLSANGDVELGNSLNGVYILNSADNIIGGITPGSGNIISSNVFWGVRINGPAEGNRIQGNLIGTDSVGAIGFGNGRSGVALFDASNNIIGGDQPGSRNIISANGHLANQHGVFVGLLSPGESVGNLIQGNYIGTDATGAIALGNTNSGVFIEGSSFISLLDNVISGNKIDGVVIDGTFHTQSATEGNIVKGNHIGVDVTGALPVSNKFNGIRIVRSARNQIGGSLSGEGNVISGNGQYGIQISSFGGSSADNAIQGNSIGLDVNGAFLIANKTIGIFCVDAGVTGTQIGGGSDEGNVIAGHQTNLNLSSSNNRIQGNKIGTDINGVPLNGVDSIGVWIIVANKNEIGGFDENSGNIISGHKAAAVVIRSGSDNLIARNQISANANDGVRIVEVIDDAANNKISENLFDDNGGQAIALGVDGVTANDAKDADDGPNGLQNFPEIRNISSYIDLTLEGSLNSVANEIFQLEFYLNDQCDGSGFGQGQSFLGGLTVNTNSAGDSDFTTTFPGAAVSSGFITSTATDAYGSTSEFSRCFEVKAFPPSPQLVSPVNDTTGLATSVNFEWQLAQTANVYHFQISLQPDFSVIVFEDSTLTGVQTTKSLSEQQVYYWRVRAGNDAGWGVFSVSERFTVGSLPVIPALLFPANAAVLPSASIGFEWQASDSGSTYQVQVATDSAFGGIVFEATNLTLNRLELTSLTKSVDYYWRVRSKNALGFSDYSSIWRFVIADQPVAPQLLFPEDQTVFQSDTLRFVWQNLALVDRYHLQVSLNQDFNGMFVNDSSLTDSTNLVQGLASGQTYFWRVRSHNPVGWGEFSSASSVSIIDVTSIDDFSDKKEPREFFLAQNYPNPFNPQTTILYSLPQSGKISIEVFDVSGRKVETLFDGLKAGGEHRILFDASGLPSGIYIYRIQAQGFVKQHKMVLMK